MDTRWLAVLLAVLTVVLPACGEGNPSSGAPQGDNGVLTVTIQPDRVTVIGLADGRASIHFPEGAVMEAVDVVVTPLDASQVPPPPPALGVREVLLGFRVEGLASTTRPVEITFPVPPDVNEPQVAHQHAGQWSMMPSHFNGAGEVVVETSTFSTFALTVGTMQSGTTSFQVPGFDPRVHAVHADNDRAVFAAEGIKVVKDEDSFYGFCYGMAETAALYYLAGRASPGARQSDLASGTDVNNAIHSVTFAEFIRDRQDQQWLNGWVWQEILRMANPLDFAGYQPMSRAEDLYVKLALGMPVAIVVSDLELLSTAGFHHAMLVYRAFKSYSESTDTLTYTFWIYDPNGYQFDGEAHDQYQVRLTVTTTNYEAGRWTPWTRITSVKYDFKKTVPEPKVFFGAYFNPVHTGLPWGNPSVASVAAQASGASVRLEAVFTHPSPGASVSQAVWYVESGDGSYVLDTEELAVTGWSASHTFTDLPPGGYSARVVVQDGQGNWSRAATAEFTIEAGSESIADHLVGAGRVATVTNVSGEIEGYTGGATDATLAGATSTYIACTGDGCEPSFVPGRPWVPATIDASGRFSIDLPPSPSLDGVNDAILCGQQLLLSQTGALYVHDAAFGEPGSGPTAMFARVRVEDPKTPVGFLADASAFVLYGFTTSSVDLTCTTVAEEPGEDPLVLDIDLRLRPGWNVMTWLQRSEGADMVLYMRTGEPGLVIPWVEPEPLY